MNKLAFLAGYMEKVSGKESVPLDIMHTVLKNFGDADFAKLIKHIPETDYDAIRKITKEKGYYDFDLPLFNKMDHDPIGTKKVDRVVRTKHYLKDL